MIAVILLLLLALVPQRALAQQPFVTHCAPCHGEDGRGTARGPGLAMNPRVAEQTVEQLRAYLERGNPAAGMPAFADLPAADLLALARYLRRINVETILPPPPAAEPSESTGARLNPATGAPTTATTRAIAIARSRRSRRPTSPRCKLKWVFPMGTSGSRSHPSLPTACCM